MQNIILYNILNFFMSWYDMIIISIGLLCLLFLLNLIVQSRMQKKNINFGIEAIQKEYEQKINSGFNTRGDFQIPAIPELVNHLRKNNYHELTIENKLNNKYSSKYIAIMELRYVKDLCEKLKI